MDQSIPTRSPAVSDSRLDRYHFSPYSSTLRIPAVSDDKPNRCRLSSHSSSACTLSSSVPRKAPDLLFLPILKTAFRLLLVFMVALLFCFFPRVSVQAATITRDSNSSFKDIAIAQTKLYNVNIRSKADPDSTIVGKLPDNCAAIIQKTVKGKDGTSWYYVKSGSVKGYIKASYCLTGSRAKKAAEDVYGLTGEVIIKRLRLRKTASSSASVLAYMLKGSTVSVIKTGIVGKDGLTYCKARYKTGSQSKKGYAAMKYYKFYYSMKTAKKVSPVSDNAGSSAKADSTPEPVSSTNPSSDAGSTGSSVAANDLGISIATEAYSYVDVLPYIYGGTSLTTGADCSGFTQSIYHEYGVSIPRTSTEQASGGKTISEDELQVGDLVFYTGINDVSGSIGHVAIYVGYGKIVHEANSARGCQLDNMNYTTPVKYVTYLRK